MRKELIFFSAAIIELHIVPGQNLGGGGLLGDYMVSTLYPGFPTEKNIIWLFSQKH